MSVARYVIVLAIGSGFVAACFDTADLGGGEIDAGQDASKDDDAATAGADASRDAASTDAAVDAGDGLAHVQFLFNGVVQTPLTCAGAKWEYLHPPSPLGDSDASSAVDSGTQSYVLRNSGSVPVAYIARYGWSLGAHYQPGVSTDDSGAELTGVLEPGDTVDVTAQDQEQSATFLGMVGSRLPFSPGAPAGDEGTISWPAGVAGSDGASTMYVAMLEEPAGCSAPVTTW